MEDNIQDSNQFITDPQTREVYMSQFQIGSRQFYLGCFHKMWKKTLIFQSNGNEEGCLAKVLAVMWSYGIKLWQQRNFLNHGGLGEVSKNIQHKMNLLVEELKRVLHRDIDYNSCWLINQKLFNADKVTYSNIIGWLDSVERIYSD